MSIWPKKYFIYQLPEESGEEKMKIGNLASRWTQKTNFIIHQICSPVRQIFSNQMVKKMYF